MLEYGSSLSTRTEHVDDEVDLFAADDVADATDVIAFVVAA